jgi:hypothetical protein
MDDNDLHALPRGIEMLRRLQDLHTSDKCRRCGLITSLPMDFGATDHVVFLDCTVKPTPFTSGSSVGQVHLSYWLAQHAML